MNEGIRLLLLSMLVSLSIGRICSNIGDCSCQEVDFRVWEIQCPSNSKPKFIVLFNENSGYCRVECHDVISWSEFEYRWTFPLLSHGRMFLRIERCPLPDESFDHIIKRLGLDWVRYLRFTSHMNLSSTLTRRHLSMVSELESLSLSSNGLTELPSDLFRDLGTLDELDLSFNEISMLPSDIFHGLSKLEKIILNYNLMKFVDWRLFVNCTKLYQIFLKGNQLTSLDHQTFRDMNHLRLINLTDNLLETLPSDAFEDTEELVLDISSNRFSTLPEKLFSQTELEKFTLGHNRGNLNTLPMNFLSNLTMLTEVVLIRNNFIFLPDNILWGSFSVESIDLHGNALSTIPENIFRDSRDLISLDISENALTYLPEGLFRALSKLQQLNLARNGIASLSENIFSNLDSLLELNLGFNEITNIQWKTFRMLPKIRMIRLSHNHLDLKKYWWGITAYYEGWTIREIFLDHNNLHGVFLIEENRYEFPANLQLVDLSYNQISSVLAYIPLVGSHDMKYDLKHNNLSEILIIDAGTHFERSPKVSILVDDNPLHCECDMYFSLKYMHANQKQQSESNFEIILGNASCSGPHWMMGMPVDSLRLETFTCRPDGDDRHVRCAEECDCWWRPHDKTRIVDCSYRSFGEMPDEIIKFVDEDDSEENSVLNRLMDRRTHWFDWRNSPVEFNLANNLLTEMRTLNGSGYEHVEWLIFSYNNVSSLSFDVLPPRIKMLRMDHNDLKTLNATSVEAMMTSTSLSEVNLEKNPWNCDGDTRNSLALLETKFGKNVRYSFDMQTCLDPRQATSSREDDRLYISFTRF